MNTTDKKHVEGRYFALCTLQEFGHSQIRGRRSRSYFFPLRASVNMSPCYLYFIVFNFLARFNGTFVGIAGCSWQGRFAKDWSDLVKFETKAEIFRVQNDPISMKEWIHERDNYTRIQIFTKYFSSRKYIWLIEAQNLKICALNKQEFPVVVSRT